MCHIDAMSKRSGAAHVVTTSRTYKDKTYKCHLLRRSYREDGKVKSETLANLSHWRMPIPMGGGTTF